jgi:KaiC/GvpD/RAD55 family RecA-like ATPase
VTFVTSQDARELQEMFARENGAAGTAELVRVVEMDAVDNLSEFAPPGGLLAVDSFSFLTIGLPPPDLARMLRDLHRVSRESRATTLLATDQGMLDSRAEAVVTHLAEGHIEFHVQEGAEGLVRFIRVPKWADGRFVDRNIYYEFDGKRLAIDLRNRVL